MNVEELNFSHIKVQLPVVLLELLTQIQHQTCYENIVSVQYKNMQNDCIWLELLPRLNTSLLTITGSSDWYSYYENHFSKNALILQCISTTIQDDVKGGLALRSLKHLIYLYAFPENETDLQKLMSKYCRSAFNAGIYNILFILPDFGITQTFFQCRLYPEVAENAYNIKQLTYGDKHSKPFDDALFSDMHGAIIWTQQNQLPPGNFLEMDDDDPMHMIGDIGSLVRLFAERYNATLRFRWGNTFQKIFSPDLIDEAVRNGSLDIVSGLQTVDSPETLETSSYLYDVDPYCWMIPLPSAMPIRLVPFSIISLQVFIIIILYMFIYGCLLSYSIVAPVHRRLIFINELVFFDMLRAMLAQSYGMVFRPRSSTKFIYVLIGFSCYIVAAMYQAFHQSFLTQPPMLPDVKDLNDAYRAGLKMMYPAIERLHVQEYRQRFGKLFILANDSSNFDEIRSTMDKQFIFPVSRRRWEIFAEQQKYFKHQMFFFSDTLCISEHAPMGIIIRPGLPYREIFNQFILRVQSAGIVENWHSQSFYDMKRLGYITAEDLSSTERRGEAITFEDLWWIWVGFVGFMLVAIIAFFFELAFNILKNTKKL